MNVQVGKWGNSFGVRIPSSLVKELGLQYGSELELQQVSGTLVLRPLAKNKIEYRLEELVAQITPENKHPETDWGLPTSKEEW